MYGSTHVTSFEESQDTSFKGRERKAGSSEPTAQEAVPHDIQREHVGHYVLGNFGRRFQDLPQAIREG